MKGYQIYTKKLANYLCKQGFKVIGTDINNQKPWLNVFIFEDSKELRKEVKKWRENANE